MLQTVASGSLARVAACALPLTAPLARSLLHSHHNASSSFSLMRHLTRARGLHSARRSAPLSRISGRPASAAARPSLSSSHARELKANGVSAMPLAQAAVQSIPARPFGSSSRLHSALSFLLGRRRVPSASTLEPQLIALFTQQLQYADHTQMASSAGHSAALHTSARSHKETPPPFPFKSPDSYAPPAPVGNLGPTPSSSKTSAASLELDHHATPAAAGGGGGRTLPPSTPPHLLAASVSPPPPHGSADSSHHSFKDGPHSHTYASQARDITSALLTTLSHSSKAQLRKLTLIVAGVLGLGAFLIYIFRDPLKGHLSEQTADVAKRSLTSSEVQMQVNVLSADVVRQLLENPAVMAQCSAFCSRLMATQETRAAVVQLLQATANDPQSLALLSRFSSQLLADLMAKPETLAQLTQLLRAAITTPGNEQALQVLFKNFAADPKTQVMVADLSKRAAMDTLHDDAVKEAAKQFMKDVTADQAVQKSTGDAMWNAIKYSIKPNWMAGSTPHAPVPTIDVVVVADSKGGNTKPTPTGATETPGNTAAVTTVVTPTTAPTVTPVAVVNTAADAVIAVHSTEPPRLLLAPVQPHTSPPSA